MQILNYPELRLQTGTPTGWFITKVNVAEESFRFCLGRVLVGRRKLLRETGNDRSRGKELSRMQDVDAEPALDHEIL
jgi:hypothetical protein